MKRQAWLRLILLFMVITSDSSKLFAHEENAHFSGAIIEPLAVHHAHIEDEQRINFFYLDRAPLEDVEEGETSRDVFKQTLELAWAHPSFRYGSEIFIPFSNEGEDDEERRYGLGDIEIQPLKYAFINRPETILTGTVAITVPTGSQSRGLGEGKTVIAPHVFWDQAHRNWYFGVNQAVEVGIGNNHEIHYEYSGVMSYSWIRETGDGIAPPKPEQFLVPQLSLEVLGETALGGSDSGQTEITVLPGFHLWHTKSGWSVRAGLGIPVTEEREANKTVYIQIGNHLNWSNIWKNSSQ